MLLSALCCGGLTFPFWRAHFKFKFVTYKQISTYIIISPATRFPSHATRFSSRGDRFPVPRDGFFVPRDGNPVPHGTVNFPVIGTVGRG